MNILMVARTLFLLGVLSLSLQADGFLIKPNELTSAVNQQFAGDLSELEAVEFAQEFIKRNGYTDASPDKESLSYESIERSKDIDDLLKSRHNTLESKAYGISQDRKGQKPGWTVVFRYKSQSGEISPKNGRAVTMNLNGSEARVEHKDFILKKVEKKL